MACKFQNHLNQTIFHLITTEIIFLPSGCLMLNCRSVRLYAFLSSRLPLKWCGPTISSQLNIRGNVDSLYRVKLSLSSQSLFHIYISIIFSCIECRCLIWSPVHAVQVEIIDKGSGIQSIMTRRLVYFSQTSCGFPLVALQMFYGKCSVEWQLALPILLLNYLDANATSILTGNSRISKLWNSRFFASMITAITKTLNELSIDIFRHLEPGSFLSLHEYSTFQVLILHLHPFHSL